MYIIIIKGDSLTVRNEKGDQVIFDKTLMKLLTIEDILVEFNNTLEYFSEEKEEVTEKTSSQ
jgi:hypothetical protein